MFKQLGVIGCGLMGGSLRAGAQARRAGQARGRLQQVAVAPPSARSKLGVIDVAAESALLAVSGSDIVLLAVPVAATEATFKAIRHLVEPGVLVMDVGSTKRDVVDAARRVLRERIGSLRAGAPDRRQGSLGHRSMPTPTLYSGRQVILTPLPQTAPELVQKATDVWSRHRLRRC